MNLIDYELGLATYSEDDFENADGRGVARATKLACEAGCFRHIRNKKRQECKSKCLAAYAAKIKVIDSQVATATADDVQNAVDTERERIAAEQEAKRIAAEKAEAERMATENSEESKGLSTGAKIGIGVGALALIVGGVILLKRK